MQIPEQLSAQRSFPPLFGCVTAMWTACPWCTIQLGVFGTWDLEFPKNWLALSGLTGYSTSSSGDKHTVRNSHYMRLCCLYYQYLALQSFLALWVNMSHQGWEIEKKAAGASAQERPARSIQRYLSRKKEETMGKTNQSFTGKDSTANCCPYRAFKGWGGLNTKSGTEQL